MGDSQSVVPDLSILIETARNIVFAAKKDDQLSSLTQKSVRKQVIQDLGLDEAISDMEQVKLAIRNAVKDAVSEDLPASIPAEKRKRSIGSVNDIKGSIPHRDGLTSEPDSKQQFMGKEDTRGSRKKLILQPRVTAKSKKMIGSDVDDEHGISVARAKVAPVSAKKQNVQDGPSNSQKQPTSTHKSTHKSTTTTEVPVVDAEKSESELSILTDEPPKKRAKKRAKSEHDLPKKMPKGTKGKEPSKPLDKDEATIKRLKVLPCQSFVSACGVRRVWSKEFADLPLAQQQIQRLKDLLAEVGLTGKYSMERAKAIREKRELARELDDVLEYERKAGASSNSRRQSTKGTKAKHIVGELDTENEAEEDSENEEPESPVVKRKNTASRSIMAYLANQSSDED